MSEWHGWCVVCVLKEYCRIHCNASLFDHCNAQSRFSILHSDEKWTAYASTPKLAELSMCRHSMAAPRSIHVSIEQMFCFILSPIVLSIVSPTLYPLCHCVYVQFIVYVTEHFASQHWFKIRNKCKWNRIETTRNETKWNSNTEIIDSTSHWMNEFFECKCTWSVLKQTSNRLYSTGRARNSSGRYRMLSLRVAIGMTQWAKKKRTQGIAIKWHNIKLMLIDCKWQTVSSSCSSIRFELNWIGENNKMQKYHCISLNASHHITMYDGRQFSQNHTPISNVT